MAVRCWIYPSYIKTYVVYPYLTLITDPDICIYLCDRHSTIGVLVIRVHVNLIRRTCLLLSPTPIPYYYLEILIANQLILFRNHIWLFTIQREGAWPLLETERAQPRLASMVLTLFPAYVVILLLPGVGPWRNWPSWDSRRRAWSDQMASRNSH